MQLTKDEKELIRTLIQRQLKEFQGEEVERDVPLNFLQAEKNYESFLMQLLEKFK